VEIGLYVDMLISELSKPKSAKTNDSGVLCAHHILTIILLLGSASIRAFSIGCLIMFIHDIADPLLEVRTVL
jgi:hypothetical protein